MEETLGMKWVAFARAYIEGYEYCFQFDFEIPDDLYDCIVDAYFGNRPSRLNERYDELLTYAEIAINYRDICGFDEGFELQYEDESDDAFGTYINEYNKKRKNNISAKLVYIRIFDPCLREEFIDYCYSLPVEPEAKGKKKRFYFSYDEGEEYEWTLDYTNEDDWNISEVKGKVSSSYCPKMLSGSRSLFPPYKDIIDGLKNGNYYSKIID